MAISYNRSVKICSRSNALYTMTALLPTALILDSKLFCEVR